MKKYIKRLIFNHSAFRLESGMSAVTLVRGNSSQYEVITNQTNLPVLTLCLNGKDGAWKDKMIKITDRSFLRFMSIITDSIKWFYDPEKKDLFHFNENGVLSFNQAYKDLCVFYNDPFDQNHFLKIMPSAIQNRDGKMVEGLIVYINKLDTLVSISRYDMESFASVIQDFSFQQEAILLSLAYYYAELKPSSIVDSTSYLQQQKQDKDLRAVPIVKRTNPFGI